MFRRLPDRRAASVTIHVDGAALSRARAGDTVAAALLAAGTRPLPHDAGHRRAARALLHDGRVLRLPRHDRRRRQPAGLPRARARGHGGRDPARQARARPMSGRDDSSSAYDVVVVGAGPAGLAAAAADGARGSLRRCCSTRTRRRAGRSIARSPTTPVQDRGMLGADYWHGAALVEAAERSGAEYRAGAPGVEPRPRSRDRRLARRRRPHDHGAPRHPRDRRARAAVPDSRLDAAGRDDRRRRADPAQGLGPRARRAHGARRHGARCCGCSRPSCCAPARSIDAILDTTPRDGYLRALRHAPGFAPLALLRQGPGADARGAHARSASIAGVTRLAAEGDDQGARRRFAARRRRRGGSTSTRCCCTRAWCRTSISRCRPASSIAGTRCSSAGRPCSTVTATRPSPASPSPATAPASAAPARPTERGRLAALAAVRALGPFGSRHRRARRSGRRLRRHERGRAFLDTLYQPPRQFRVPAGRHHRLPLRGGHGAGRSATRPRSAARARTR